MKTIALLAAGAFLWMAAVRAQAIEGWREDGKRIADTDNVKAKDGFGAQLFLTESEKFFEDWNKPETPIISRVQKVRRNVPIYTVIVFADPGVDSAKRAKVNCHAIVRKPDGSVYGELDLVVWNGDYVVPPRNLQLAKDRIGIRIEPTDPAGMYTVEATVRDEIKKVELPLKITFEVAQ